MLKCLLETFSLVCLICGCFLVIYNTEKTEPDRSDIFLIL